MRKTRMMVSLMMQSFFTIITLLRKVTEYIVSTLLTLKKSKINNTALTIPHKALNVKFLSQITTATTHNQNSTRNSKTKMYTYPYPPSIEDICTWYSRGRGRARFLELQGHRLYGEKTRSLESQLERKRKKNQCLRECRAAHT